MPPHPAASAALRARFASQSHVFDFLDRGLVAEAEVPAFVAQLEAIDVALVEELFAATVADAEAAAAAAGAGAGAGAAAAAPLEPCRDVTRVAAAAPQQVAAWRAAGVAAVRAGQVAALILAGGQGTRLGSDRPKGEYDVGLPSARSLFRLQCERARRLRDEAGGAGNAAGARLPLYVMTSPMTDADTRAFFAANANFGLPAEDVRFFCQGTLPCMTLPGGRIMLESGGRVAEAPDGNGGIYRALHLSGCVADMQRRGVLGVHVFAVDNAVVKVADPVFVGFCLERGADVGSKACPKAGPHEKVGVLCVRGGRHTVVEYSEMDRAAAERRDAATGELAFNAGNICIHFFSTAFLAGPCAPERLPKVYHLARKAIPVADAATGRTLGKEALAAALGGAPHNGVKLESFIFDVFPAAERLVALEILREEEFSPVKNAPGAAEDSPDTARALVSALHRRWLAAAGAEFEPASAPAAAATAAAAAAGGLVEVSPLLSLGGEGLGAFAGLVLRAPLLALSAGEALPPRAGAAEAAFEVVARPSAGSGAAAADAAPVSVARLPDGLSVYRVGPSE
jgi:UDP-N-acetylglucosamine/UDP-N-acetylgalactosamine diphosphorylase